jgi:hypothetical protein
MAANIPNGRKINRIFPFQDPPECTQIGIFRMKIIHLATLVMPNACLTLQHKNLKKDKRELSPDNT